MSFVVDFQSSEYISVLPIGDTPLFKILIHKRISKKIIVIKQCKRILLPSKDPLFFFLREEKNVLTSIFLSRMKIWMFSEEIEKT